MYTCIVTDKSLACNSSATSDDDANDRKHQICGEEESISSPRIMNGSKRFIVDQKKEMHRVIERRRTRKITELIDNIKKELMVMFLDKTVVSVLDLFAQPLYTTMYNR
jgi:hypothetical protein